MHGYRKAQFDFGYIKPASMLDAAVSLGDVFITVTGCKDVVRGQHYENMKSGAILANAGHFDVEINKPELNKYSMNHRTVRQRNL